MWHFQNLLSECWLHDYHFNRSSNSVYTDTIEVTLWNAILQKNVVLRIPSAPAHRELGWERFALRFAAIKLLLVRLMGGIIKQPPACGSSLTPSGCMLGLTVFGTSAMAGFLSWDKACMSSAVPCWRSSPSYSIFFRSGTSPFPPLALRTLTLISLGLLSLSVSWNRCVENPSHESPDDDTTTKAETARSAHLSMKWCVSIKQRVGKSWFPLISHRFIFFKILSWLYEGINLCFL